MDDLDDVRAALGYSTINLYGASYGATAAQVYLLRHEARVRTATLVAGSSLDVPMFERYPASSQAALDAVLDRCVADADYQASCPAVRQELVEVLAWLEQQPATLSLIDPNTGQPASVVITREMFATGLYHLLRSTATAMLVPKAIHLLYASDGAGLAALLFATSDAGNAVVAWTIMNLTINCHEAWALLRPAETAASDPESYLRYADVRALAAPAEICGVVPRPEAAALYGPVSGASTPVLLLNGQADPQDPPGNVADASQRYPNSLTLVAPGQAHASTGVTCRTAIVADFIARGTTAGLAK
jgi:pimeloyl-ACP methyl ester carboxylesterase